LLKDDGTGVEGIENLSNFIGGYFRGLFTSDDGDPAEAVLDKVKQKVTQPMNEALLEPFTAEEVKKALFSIGDLKAPGPDGLHTIFYKRCWPMVEEDLIAEVLQALNSAKISEGWNDIVIVLIPKNEDLKKVTEYRPISLRNVIYKVFRKLLATRLKGILPEIIGEQQSAFVPRRMITDNILIAYECVHTIKRKEGKQ
jgi:hypothetical protein